MLDFLSESPLISNECAGGYVNKSDTDCPKTCKNGDGFGQGTKCEKESKRQYITVDDIKYELHQNGPVVSTMVIYQDLLTYESGVYYHKEGEIIGGHAVLLVGWGKTKEGIEYWEVQNSWGSDWGENNGFFRIKFEDSEIATELFGGVFTCSPEQVSVWAF